MYSCSTDILVGLLSVTFFQTIVPTQFASPKNSFIRQQRFCILLSSMLMKITPVSDSSSRNSARLGQAIQSHLSCLSRSSRSTIFPSHCFMRELLPDFVDEIG